MNYLAHVLLAGPDPHWQIGGYLGDHVRGRRWMAYPPGMARGILLHRKIDVFTDSHPAFSAARSRLEPRFRRFAGVLLDMFFDHFLARDFEALTGRNLSLFAGVTYTNLRAHWHLLPDSLQRFARYQEQHNLLTAYAAPDSLQMVLEALSRRIRRDNPLAEGMSQLNAHRAGFEADFIELMAALRAFSSEQRVKLADRNLAADHANSQPVME